MATMTLPNGIVIDDEGGACPTLRARIEYNNLFAVRVYLATHSNGDQEYVLVEGVEPIFASTSTEEVWSRIDLLKLTQFQEEDQNGPQSG